MSSALSETAPRRSRRQRAEVSYVIDEQPSPSPPPSPRPDGAHHQPHHYEFDGHDPKRPHPSQAYSGVSQQPYDYGMPIVAAQYNQFPQFYDAAMGQPQVYYYGSTSAIVDLSAQTEDQHDLIQPVQPVQQPVHPVQQPVQPVQQPVHPIQQPVQTPGQQIPQVESASTKLKSEYPGWDGAPSTTSTASSSSKVDSSPSAFVGATSMANMNPEYAAPLVEMTFVDPKLCAVCGKKITRDMARHMRTHQEQARFTCLFYESGKCTHKSGRFNRPYDFKKHLLNRHFKFDNPKIKSMHNLSDKLDHMGTCPCGLHCTGGAWLDDHVLSTDNRCQLLE